MMSNKSARKVCVVLTARTSYTKLKSILIALKADHRVEVQLVCAASALLEKYGRVDVTVEHDGFTIDERISLVLAGETPLTAAKSTGIGVVEFAGAFDRLKPDVVVVVADRFEATAPAIAAVYQNIPLAHVQGGEVSGNIDEKVRHAITKLADLHFPATERAREWLIRMGEHPETVFRTGCPSTDLAEAVIQGPEMDFDVYEKYGGVGSFPDLSAGFIVVMQHPVTTEHAEARSQAVETLEAVRGLNRSVLWFWPNPDAGGGETSKAIRIFREHTDSEPIQFIKNMEPEDFLRLLYSSDGIVGNSSVAIRECSYLGVPAVNLGTRQSNRERGPNVIDVPHERAAIKAAIQAHLNGHVSRSNLYGDGDAGEQIAGLLASVPLSFNKTLNYI